MIRRFWWWILSLKFKLQLRNCKCKLCGDGDFFPIYGLAPHRHSTENGKLIIGGTEFTGEIPDNFVPDDECNTHGVYYCPNEGCENSKEKFLELKND